MRLHRVKLCNYRGVAGCEVEFPTQGITVIEGPNEVGKTSIPEGLDLVLTKKDSSEHRQVKSTQPVGCDVGPEVEIEMSTGEYRFVYRKRWLRRSETVLNVLLPRRDKLTGLAAHERVEEILDATLDRELWRALRIEQGVKLSLPGFDVPSLVGALDQAASGDDASDEDDDLWTRICQERDQYWTVKGGTKKDRSAKKVARETAESKVSGLKKQIENIDRDATVVSCLVTEKGRLVLTRDECEQQASTLSEQWNATGQLRNKVERLTAASDAAALKRDGIASEQQRRQELIGEFDSRAGELKELEARAQQSAPALAAAIRHARQTETALEETGAAVKVAEAEKRRAEEDRDHHRNRGEVLQISVRYERVVEAEKRLQEADKLLESVKVDDDLLGQIEEAYLAVMSSREAVASVETTASRELSMEINGERVVLGAGEMQRTVVDEDVVLVLPDVAEIRVRGGTGSQSLATERRHAQQELRRLCTAAGVVDQTEARQAAEKRKDAERQRHDAQGTITRDLQDLTVDVLRREVEQLTKRINAYVAERPEEPPLPANYETAKQVASAKARSVEERQAGLDTCDQMDKCASSALQEERINESKLAGMIEIARNAEKQAAESLESARSQQADSEIAAELAKTEEDARAARESREDVQAELSAAEPESLKVRLKNAQDAAQRASVELSANEQKQNNLRIALSVLGEEGLYTRREEAVRRFRHLEREHQRTEAKAEAARLLHDTFSRRRQEARQRYSGPFKQRIEQLGRIVFNPSFSVDIDDRLSIARRTLDGDTLQVDQLSTGALEQLAVISRLACAAIVSPDGSGTPVIIDDALGWSDPDRLERMGAAIAATGEQCQVIILTCTPGRYAHIGTATTFRLPTGI